MADPGLPAGQVTVCWLPECAPAAVAIAAETSSVCASSVLPPRFDIIDRIADGRRCWIGLRNGATIVAPADFDPDAPFGVLFPLDDHWPVRSRAAERLHRHLLGLPITPVLPPQAHSRFAAALRSADAQAAGAHYREIAEALFGDERVAAEYWPTSALKAQTVRLATYGRWLIAKGSRDLLRGRLGRRSLLIGN